MLSVGLYIAHRLLDNAPARRDYQEVCSMLTEQRHDIILQLLKEKGSITVTEIKECLNVSESTIRRDLMVLDRENKLVKVFGGAVLAEENVMTTELSVSQKEDVNTDEKQIIAQYAAKLINEDDFVYIDAGTTTGYMIDYITQKNATYVTNAVTHARKLAAAGFRVIIIGGELKGTTEAVVGSQALINIKDYHFTKGFFGTNGINRKCGFSTPDSNEAMIKKIAMEHCNHRYILADQEKFGKVTSVAFARFEDAIIITNSVPKDTFGDCDNIMVAHSNIGI